MDGSNTRCEFTRREVSYTIFTVILELNQYLYLCRLWTINKYVQWSPLHPNFTRDCDVHDSLNSVRLTPAVRTLLVPKVWPPSFASSVAIFALMMMACKHPVSMSTSTVLCVHYHVRRGVGLIVLVPHCLYSMDGQISGLTVRRKIGRTVVYPSGLPPHRRLQVFPPVV